MTIFKKNLITLGIAVLVFSAVLAVSVMVFMNSLYYETNMTGLKNTARALMTTIGNDRLVEIFLSNEGEQHPNQISFPVINDEAYRFTLILPSGYVLWDSHVTDRLVNHIDREEVIAALDGREVGSVRDSISTGMKRIYYALPVYDQYNNITNNNIIDNNIIGVFRLSLSIPEFTTRISAVLFPFIVFICLLIIAAFLAVIFYSHSLSISFGRLASIAQTGTVHLSGSNMADKIAPDFFNLEKSLRAMTEELNLQFEQAKSEGSRLEAILNGMSEAVFAMDHNLRLHMVNPKARDLFNPGNRDIKTMTLLDVTRSTELVDIAKKAISGGSPLETEMRFYFGTEKYFQVHASPIFKGNVAAGSVAAGSVAAGSVAVNSGAENSGIKTSEGVVLVLQEITRLVKLERVRKDFVANVSHELRTPIQLIKGFSETLLDSKAEPANQIHFLEIIHKNAIVMENLTNDLLILSSLENNHVNAHDLEELNIISLIYEAVSSVELHAKEKQMEIIVECQEDLSAKLYGSLIVQALINLIDNGIIYSPVKSKLWVNAFQNTVNSELIFEVRDKGIGIHAEHHERIFERFYRVDRARSGNQGTGLGLSIVRHIALLHKGNAEVESRSGEGSVFKIRIPMGTSKKSF